MINTFVTAKESVVKLKSFATFAAMSEIINEDGTYKCPRCEGDKKVKDYDNYDRDPIEGYKFCPRIICPLCHGTGISDESYWNTFYKSKKDKLKEKKKILQKEKDTMNLINSCLTSEQLNFLRKYGFQFNPPEPYV